MMQRIHCTACGSSNLTMIGEDTFQCNYCGCKYSTEQVRHILTGCVETYNGSKELSRQLNNIKASISFGDKGEARNGFRSIAKAYTSESIVWREWLAFELSYLAELTQKYSLLSCINIFSDEYADLKTIYNNAICSATTSEAKARIQAEWENYWNNIVKKLRDGEYLLVGPIPHYESLWQTLKANTSPYYHVACVHNNYFAYDDYQITGTNRPVQYLKSLDLSISTFLDEGITLAQSIENSGVYFGFPSYFEHQLLGWWPVWDTSTKERHLLYASNKQIIWLYSDENTWRGNGILTFHHPVVIDSQFIKVVHEEAQQNLQYMTYCPYCTTGKLKRSLFGRRCSNCNRPI